MTRPSSDPPLLRSGRPARWVALGVILLAAGLFLSEESARPSLSDDPIRIGHRLLDAWQVPEAGRIAEGLLERKEESPAVAFFLGRYYFERGDYERALDYVNGAGDYRGEDQNLLNYVPYLEAAHRNTRDFQQKESAHFVVRYPEGKEAILPDFALETMEKTYEALKSDLGFAPSDRIAIEFYPKLSMLADATGLTLAQLKTSGTIAVCKFNRMMVSSPRVGALGYSWRDTLNHEYAHLAISRVSANTTPIWLHEGLAKFLEERWRRNPGGELDASMESLLARAVKEEKLISFEAMHPSMALLPSQEHTALAFAEVLTLVQWLYTLRGGEGFRQLLAALKENRGEINGALRRVYGFDMAGMEVQWRAQLARRSLRQDDSILDDYSILFDGPAKEEETEGRTVGKKDRGNHYMILGRLLKDRKHPKAAVIEYRKAQMSMGFDHPALQNSLADALLELRQYPEAEAALRPITQRAPNFLPARLRLAEALIEQKKPAEALVHLTFAVGLNPFDPRVWGLFIRAYEQLNQPDQEERARGFLKLAMGR